MTYISLVPLTEAAIMKRIILAIITPLVTSVALGGMTIECYKEISKDEELKHIATAYVTGLGEGFFGQMRL